jgi:NADPH:quinone reductase-like Zn-dependent oxidoreductase
MKAAQRIQYGPPEIVQIVEIDKPIPKEGKILIRVFASTVNRTNSGFRSAEYIISRFGSGLFKLNQTTLGSEFVGVVEAIGKAVSLFKEGDRALGYDDVHLGGHAEYLCLSEKESITTIPDRISYSVATALTEGAHYALNNTRASGIQSGQKIGTIILQIQE